MLRQICCLSRASGVIVVVSGHSIVSVVFRLVRCWLFCSRGFWLRLFVARFSLAEVCRGVRCSQSSWSLLLSVVSGRGDTWWPGSTLGRKQVSSWHSATSGRRVMRARLVFWRSGASGMGRHFCGVFEISALRLDAVTGLDICSSLSWIVQKLFIETSSHRV